MNGTSPAADAIWQALAAIPDPEFGINIVDLGLIYSVECTDGIARVVMTLTTPTCPSGSWIYEGVRRALAGIPGIRQAEVQLVFDPPGNPEMLSAQAREDLER
jgi:metal-sulfur cluster biosynthetic enzyme